MVPPRTTKIRRLRWSWILVGVSGAFVYGLGYTGFDRYFHLAGEAKTWRDLAYLTGQLFTVESGAVGGVVPWQLEVARFGAPLVAAWAVVGTLAALFSDEWRRWALRFQRGHVIVCGLGRTGGRLVEELRLAGERVVVIEPDAGNPELARCRLLKAVVVTGRSEDEWTLARARIDTAARLVATAGDDSVNVETVVRAREFAARRAASLDPLQCVAHITDPSLQQLLKGRNLFAGNREPLELELVNVYEVGARVMLGHVAGGGDAPPEASRRVCIIGLGHFGEAVLRRLLRDQAIRAEGGGKGASLDLVVVDREAAAKEVSVRQRYREFLGSAKLHFVARDVRATDFSGEDLAVAGPEQRIDAFFVCFDDDSLATLAALRIRECFGPEPPVVVRMAGQAGFASLMEGNPGGCTALCGIKPIGFLDIACMRDLFIGGDNEVTARAFHEAYVEERLSAGETTEANPAMAPWDQLSEHDRVSSRSRAAAVREQLDRAGFEISPCPHRPVVLHRFTPESVETLSRIEHERWLAAKRADGWSYGPKRDATRKHNPFLVEWEVLPEAEKEFNRATVIRLPAIFARADFEIREKPPGDG